MTKVMKQALDYDLNSLYWQAHYFQSTSVSVLMDSQTHFSCLSPETLTRLGQSFILTVYWPWRKTSSVALKEAGSILACHLTTFMELMYTCAGVASIANTQLPWGFCCFFRPLQILLILSIQLGIKTIYPQHETYVLKVHTCRFGYFIALNFLNVLAQLSPESYLCFAHSSRV